MKVGFQFKINDSDCIVCDIKSYYGKKFANICIENGDNVDYRIYEIIENDGKVNLMEVKDENLLDKIMPLFVFESSDGKEIDNMVDKYLPIGTVVILKNAKKRVMITGYACSSPENGDRVFDYCGCLYPEGVISSSQNMLFDHNQIEKIFFIGYNDEEAKEFQAKLNDLINKKED